MHLHRVLSSGLVLSLDNVSTDAVIGCFTGSVLRHYYELRPIPAYRLTAGRDRDALDRELEHDVARALVARHLLLPGQACQGIVVSRVVLTPVPGQDTHKVQ